MVGGVVPQLVISSDPLMYGLEIHLNLQGLPR